MTSELEENRILQAEEIEALAVIYGSEYKIETEDQKIFKITLTDSTASKSIFLQVTLPAEYPLLGPPMYEFSAPWLNRNQKHTLCNELETLYSDHLGESILFMWTERIREFLDKSSDESVQTLLPEESPDLNEELDIPLEIAMNICSTTSNKAVRKGSDESCSEDDIPIQHGEPIKDRKSTFQAHLAPVVSIEQVEAVKKRLLQNRKIASATHNISAYRIYLEPKNSFLQDCDDDGETHAGSRLLHLLQILNTKNVLVIVSRWYGGIQLGPDRFKHINNVARSLLKESGYITEQKEDPHPNTTKSKKKKCK